MQKRVRKVLRERATKEKLGGNSDGALTVSKTNELEKYYKRAIINNTYYLKICKIPSKLVYTIIRRQPEDLTTADVQRVHHHHDAVLIKENESDQRESNGNPNDRRSFIVQKN